MVKIYAKTEEERINFKEKYPDVTVRAMPKSLKDSAESPLVCHDDEDPLNGTCLTGNDKNIEKLLKSEQKND